MSDTAFHPIEKKLLTALSNLDSANLQQLEEKSGLSLDQIRRGVEWLKSKKLVETHETENDSYSLGELGTRAIEFGLPERRIVNAVKKAGGVEEITPISRLLGTEFGAAFGIAKKNKWIRIEGTRIFLAKGHENREPEEDILEKIAGEKRLSREALTDQELQTIEVLEKRYDGFVIKTRTKAVSVELTPEGRNALKTLVSNEIDEITPEVLRTGSWKEQPLRAIDVVSPAPAYYPGRRHPMRLFMNEVREAFISLGFEEIYGSMSQSALWNFDALFIPQQHPAREMQDTFYLAKTRANLERYDVEIRAIKSAHEEGADTGSRGWRYPWSVEEASRVVLRTHTTAVTISYLAEKRPEEARVFSVGRVFRNEKSNYKHNPEFYQIEGVMVGKKLNVRNLIYTLSKFYSKLGFNEIKFWPTYFPYTEPSLQTMVYLKEAGRWMELGGMGPFRPEVTLPLGVKNPVLAWGLSLDRLVMLRYHVDDIRQLFGANLGWLRKSPVG
jgi:phenylalanyl-tRNA synthetase alpha chain